MNNMTTKELKAMAKELKVKNWWNLKKDELIAAIEAAQNESGSADDTTTADVTADTQEAAQNEPETTESTDEDESNDDNVSESVQDEPESAPAPKAAKHSAKKKSASDTNQNKPDKKQNLITYNGETKNLSQWAKELGMPGQTLFARIHISKWPVEKAFTTPVKKRNKKEEA